VKAVDARPTLLTAFALIAGAIVLGQASASPLGVTTYLPLGVLLAVMLVAAYTNPVSVIWIGGLAPFATLASGSSLIQLGAMGLLIAGLTFGWRGATAVQRRRSVQLLALGFAAGLLGIAFAPHTAQTPSLVLGILHACLLGGAAALLSPSVRSLQMIVGVAGSITALIALRTPELLINRDLELVGENANGVGLLCALGFGGAIGGAWSRDRFLPLWLCVAGLTGRGVWFSGSRGALIACCFAVAVLILNRRLAHGRGRAILTLTGIGATAFVVANPLLKYFLVQVGRDSSGAAGNVIARRESLMHAVEVGVQNPFTGVGLGRLNEAGSAETLANGLRAHNVFAGMFAESGVIVVGIMLLLCVAALERARIYAPTTLLPLLATVLVGGFTFEWWGTSRLGVLAMLAIGTCLTCDRSVNADGQSRSATKIMSKS
jgi:hypothetical protein